MPITRAERTYMKEVRAGRHPNDAYLYMCGPAGRIPAVRTVRAWREAVEHDGPDALKRTRAETKLPYWADEIMRIHGRPSKPPATQVLEEFRARYEPNGVIPPSISQVRRFVRTLGPIQKNHGRMLSREMKRLRAYRIRDHANLDPGDVYVADGHRADFEVRHWKTGRPIRPEIILVIDVATRKAVGWSAGLDESSWLVADALRKAVETNGIPSIFYTDHGCGFKNQRFCAATTGLLARLGITHKLSIPYNSQARGVVERAHQTIWVSAGRKLPSFVGADMDPEARQRVFKRGRREIKEFGKTKVLPEWNDFCKLAATEVMAYNARPHRGLKRFRDQHGNWAYPTPDQVWQRAVDAGWSAVMPQPAETRDLFRPYEMRKVRRAHVYINSGAYFAPHLEALDLHGSDVRVGFDPTDPTFVWVRNLDDEFICRATLDGSKTDYFPASVLERADQKRAESQKLRLTNKINVIDEELGAGVIPFPSGEPMPEAARAALTAEIAASAADPVDESPDVLGPRADDLLARQAAGEVLPEREIKWAHGYLDTSEYRSWKAMQDDPEVVKIKGERS